MVDETEVALPHPYTSLPPRAFWRSGVALVDRDQFAGLYDPKFQLTRDTRIATAGSCFAGHIGTHLRAAGCHLLDGEPAPAAMRPPEAARFGYGLYSGRYGHIYSTRQLRELLAELAHGQPNPGLVWSMADRFVDALRPSVEPDGLDRADEVLLHRTFHLARTAQMLRQAEVLILTLGLTEVWVDLPTGRALPSCPGVIAGTFDPARHQLHLQTHAEVLADLHAIRQQLQGFRAGMRLMLSVSPVPLTATATGDHVLLASGRAKAVLRAAAGEMAGLFSDVDYVPSYELLTHPAMGPGWFAPNLREVTPQGVARVMRLFLTAHGLEPGTVSLPQPQPQSVPQSVPQSEPRSGPTPRSCDDVLLDAFAPPTGP